MAAWARLVRSEATSAATAVNIASSWGGGVVVWWVVGVGVKLSGNVGSDGIHRRFGQPAQCLHQTTPTNPNILTPPPSFPPPRRYTCGKDDRHHGLDKCRDEPSRHRRRGRRHQPWLRQTTRRQHGGRFPTAQSRCPRAGCSTDQTRGRKKGVGGEGGGSNSHRSPCTQTQQTSFPSSQIGLTFPSPCRMPFSHVPGSQKENGAHSRS